MTIVTMPGGDLEYFLVSHDKHGNERADDPDADSGRLSDRLLDALANDAVTDVFFISHGWKGDVPAAISQYNDWIGAMLQCDADRRQVREIRPEFKPLLIGLHWPSLPWGCEEQPRGAVAFGQESESLESMIDEAADRIADSDRAREALATIFAAAIDDIEPAQLPDEVVEAYAVLAEEAGLEADGPAGKPGADSEPFDPEQAYQSSRGDEDVFFGASIAGGLISPLRQLSFWTMKNRARVFGETGASDLLRRLQTAAAESGGVNFHLMGHSFGCIVISAMIAGAESGPALVRPIDTVYLVQGALSLWSYCADIPVAKGNRGYFNRIISEGRVRGPLLTTQSEHDTAVGSLYPVAAGVSRQVTMAPGDLPKYGALGAFGVRGKGAEAEDLVMLPADGEYHFDPGKVYNIESSEYIAEGGGLSGAHNDISRPEVAHAFWQAVCASMRREDTPGG